jgi:cold shock CspA family protein
MMRGSITGILRKKGCGFILGEDGCEVFFDRSTLGETDIGVLSVGQWVEYEIAYGFERMRAAKVRLLPAAAHNEGRPVAPLRERF